MKVGIGFLQIFLVASVGVTSFVSKSLEVEREKQQRQSAPAPARAILGIPTIAADATPDQDETLAVPPAYAVAGFREPAQELTPASGDPQPVPAAVAADSSQREHDPDVLHLICPPTIVPEGLLTEEPGPDVAIVAGDAARL